MACSSFRSSDHVLNKEKQIAQQPCSSCEWSFESVLGWSDSTAFLASFIDADDPITKKKTRVFSRLVESKEMFPDAIEDSDARVWGCREKVYRVSDGEVRVADFSPAEEKKSKVGVTTKTKEKFEDRGSYQIDSSNQPVVAMGTAPFGTIIEFPDRLIVQRSDGGTQLYVGELVHWRVFPRSENYSNQLHLIYEDRIDIVSFVHDYFVDQKAKLSGFARTAVAI
jgi:hypothetical protein